MIVVVGDAAMRHRWSIANIQESYTGHAPAKRVYDAKIMLNYAAIEMSFLCERSWMQSTFLVDNFFFWHFSLSNFILILLKRFICSIHIGTSFSSLWVLLCVVPFLFFKPDLVSCQNTIQLFLCNWIRIHYWPLVSGNTRLR